MRVQNVAHSLDIDPVDEPRWEKTDATTMTWKVRDITQCAEAVMMVDENKRGVGWLVYILQLIAVVG